MRTVLLTLTLVMLLSSVALAWSHWWSENPAGYLEMSTFRHEQNGRLLIQMRPIFEGVGWAVDWDPDGKRLAASHGDARIEMQVGSSTALVGGQAQTLEVAPRIIEGVVYVPLRYVCEMTGAKVQYLGRAVRVTSPDGIVLLVHLMGV